MAWQLPASGSKQIDEPGAALRGGAAPFSATQARSEDPQPRMRARPAPCSDAERQLLIQQLQESNCNITQSAAALSVSRVTFYRMLKRNGLTLRQEVVLGSSVNANDE